MTRAPGALAAVALASTVALAQPADPLRDGHAAAAAGDWPRVTALVHPLLGAALPPADLAEAHRLAGLAAYHQQRLADAERYFLVYLRHDLDGQLDPALYTPDVVTFFNDVRIRHAAELRARRPQPRRYWLLNLVPPGGQIQNGERTKAFVVGGLLAGFAAGNLASYLVLRSWCTRVAGDAGGSATCDDSEDRSSTAAQLRVVNLVTGAGLLATYAYGVYDGITGYRARSTEVVRPYVMTTATTALIGVGGTF